MDAFLATSLGPAFLTGLLGSGHCAAMCAAPMGAVTGTDAAPRLQLAGIPVNTVPGAVSLSLPLAAQAGRIATYALTGALAGAAGSGLNALPNPAITGFAQGLLALGAQVMLILTGLFLVGHTRALGWLESIVTPLWNRLHPLTRRVLPVSRPGAAFAFGALWGWIPCGLSWAMLGVALGAGNAANGALAMLAFGVGTLPVMLAGGVAAQALLPRLKSVAWRCAAGLAVLLMGVAGVVRVASSDHRAADALALCAQVLGFAR